jgi:hypothetical protein
MTVASEIHTVVSPGNGSTFTHAFTGMEVFATSELLVLHVVIATNAVTIVSEGTGATNYAVTYNNPLVDGKSDGSLTYPADEVTPMPATEQLVIIRTPDLLQGTALKNLGVQLPKTMETVLDKMQHQIQALQEQLDRCPKLKQGIDMTSIDLTLPDPKAGYGWQWDSAAEALEEVLG